MMLRLLWRQHGILRGSHVGKMDVVVVVMKAFVVSDVGEKPLGKVGAEAQFLPVFVCASASNNEILSTKSRSSSCR